MGEPVWTRAAVVHASERGAHAEAAGSFHLTANGANDQVLRVVVLPEGRRVGEYGRTLLATMPAQTVRCTVPNWVAELLWWAGRERHDGRERVPPIDLPVWADGETGLVIEVHVATLEQELLPWRDEAVWLWKRTESVLSPVRGAAGAPGFLARFGGSVLKEWKEALGDMKADMQTTGPPPGERPAGQIEGVDYRTWIWTKALMIRDEVHPAHVDLFTHFRGVPWGRWAAIDAAWTQHAPREWADYDLRRLKPTGVELDF